MATRETLNTLLLRILSALHPVNSPLCGPTFPRQARSPCHAPQLAQAVVPSTAFWGRDDCRPVSSLALGWTSPWPSKVGEKATASQGKFHLVRELQRNMRPKTKECSKPLSPPSRMTSLAQCFESPNILGPKSGGGRSSGPGGVEAQWPLRRLSLLLIPSPIARHCGCNLHHWQVEKFETSMN